MVYELRAPFEINWTANAEIRNWKIDTISVRYVPGTNDPSYPYHRGFGSNFKIAASEVPPQYMEAIGRISYWVLEQKPLTKPLNVGGQIIPSLVKAENLRMESGELSANFRYTTDEGVTSSGFTSS